MILLLTPSLSLLISTLVQPSILSIILNLKLFLVLLFLFEQYILVHNVEKSFGSLIWLLDLHVWVHYFSNSFIMLIVLILSNISPSLQSVMSSSNRCLIWKTILRRNILIVSLFNWIHIILLHLFMFYLKFLINLLLQNIFIIDHSNL